LLLKWRTAWINKSHKIGPVKNITTILVEFNLGAAVKTPAKFANIFSQRE
jgi:hypothetical protein